MTKRPDTGNIRAAVHLAMLAKSENAKDLGELTVVPLGFAVTIAIDFFADKLAGLLEEKAWALMIGQSSYAIPVSAVERLIREMKS